MTWSERAQQRGEREREREREREILRHTIEHSRPHDSLLLCLLVEPHWPFVGHKLEIEAKVLGQFGDQGLWAHMHSEKIGQCQSKADEPQKQSVETADPKLWTQELL